MKTSSQVAEFIRSLNNTSLIGSSIASNFPAEGYTRKIFFHASNFALEAVKREFGTYHVDWSQTGELGRRVYFVEI